MLERSTKKLPLHVPPLGVRDPADVAKTLERGALSARGAAKALRGRAPENTQEIRLEDVLEVAYAPAIRDKVVSAPEVEIDDVIEVVMPAPTAQAATTIPRPAHHVTRETLVSVNVTQEIAVDDVLEAVDAPLVDHDVDAFVSAERPSERPFVVDTGELHAYDRITVLTPEQVSMRKRRGALIVGTAVGLAAALFAFALSARTPMAGDHRKVAHANLQRVYAPTQHTHPSRTLDTTPAAPVALSMSVDDLPKSKRRR